MKNATIKAIIAGSQQFGFEIPTGKLTTYEYALATLNCLFITPECYPVYEGDNYVGYMLEGKMNTAKMLEAKCKAMAAEFGGI